MSEILLAWKIRLLIMLFDGGLKITAPVTILLRITDNLIDRYHVGHEPVPIELNY